MVFYLNFLILPVLLWIWDIGRALYSTMKQKLTEPDTPKISVKKKTGDFKVYSLLRKIWSGGLSFWGWMTYWRQAPL